MADVKERLLPKYLFPALTLACLCLAAPAMAAGQGEAAPGVVMEELHFRIGLGFFQDMAHARLTLTSLGEGRYRAELHCTANRGFGLIQRLLPELYRTDMAKVDGKLLPLVFREVFYLKGRRISKEYRFNHEHKRLQYWRAVDKQPLAQRWERELTPGLTDCLTLIYNARTGGLGPLPAEGDLKFPAIPNPEALDLAVHLGPAGESGRQASARLLEPSTGQQWGPYEIEVSPAGVPQKMGMRVLGLGELKADLLPESKPLARPME
jgi:hypothetical protein